jgi:hypothetical protein
MKNAAEIGVKWWVIATVKIPSTAMRVNASDERSVGGCDARPQIALTPPGEAMDSYENSTLQNTVSGGGVQQGGDSGQAGRSAHFFIKSTGQHQN